MALSHGRVVAIGETLYPHEQEGIDFAIQAVPDTDPYHLWALIDLLDKSTGRYVEIDLLILGYSCLYLVELKAWPGRIEGDSIDWTWTAPEGRSQWKEHPLRLTRRKAQILKSRLERAMPPGVRAPWIEPLVFLSYKDVKLGLTPDGILGVLRREDFIAAITRHEFRGADPRHQGQRIDTVTKKAVVKALGELGFRQRRGKLHVGPYELGELLDEAEAYQDRIATQRDLELGKKPVQRRARTYLVPEQTSIERRQQLSRAADREAQLLYEVSQHPNILTYAEYITDAPLGPTVLLEDFEQGVPLDTFIRQHPALPFLSRIALIEQIGRALEGAVHGGVCPSAVLVRLAADGTPESRLFNFQPRQGRCSPPHERRLRVRSRDLVALPVERGAGASGAAHAGGRHLRLGAVTFLVATGQPPAANLLERKKMVSGIVRQDSLDGAYAHHGRRLIRLIEAGRERCFHLRAVQRAIAFGRVEAIAGLLVTPGCGRLALFLPAQVSLENDRTSGRVPGASCASLMAKMQPRHRADKEFRQEATTRPPSEGYPMISPGKSTRFMSRSEFDPAASNSRELIRDKVDCRASYAPAIGHEMSNCESR